MRLLLLILLVLSGLGCAERTSPAGEEHLLLLQNHDYVVGLLPKVGGRVVVFRRIDGDNVLLSDPSQWGQAGPEVSATSSWTTYNGHITWIGPQDDWWTKQDLNTKRKEKASRWPPDPWLVFGDYAISEQSPTSVVLTGPSSPVSGLALRKQYDLRDDGLHVSVTATNTSDAEVSWDLWSNTRFDARDTATYVPLPEKGAFWIDPFRTNSPLKRGPLFYRIIGTHFTIPVDSSSSPGVENHNVKYFMDPGAPYLAAVSPSDCFIKHITIAEGKPAPAHGRVEIYNHRTARGALLEVEHHGAYTTLQAGDSMSLSERWELHPYTGDTTPEAQAAFVAALFE
ncbi:MAG: DUF4380 domain-containing protein [Planctomycetota bacterium]|jgi:hypothetical protein|nr:DUF4380 domain-containing protein [Planctomycetota bacterium]